MPLKIDELRNFLKIQQKDFQINSVAIIGFKSENFILSKKIIKNFFLSNLNSKWPDYLIKTAELRATPQKTFPWAKTAVILSIPFHHLPVKNTFIPLGDNQHYQGLVAGYGGRLDYHIYGKEIAAKFADNLGKYTKKSIKSEICIDTKPLPEKTLAAAANLGRIGKNTCILTANEGSGCFIVTILLNIELPEIKPKNINDFCHDCDKCRQICPNHVLRNSQNDFNCPSCRSYLTMDVKGELSKKQQKMLGEWIFGCDLCTGVCPESKLPETLKVDLEWLLTSPSAEVKKAIKDSPLEYAGITQLRRNSLYVLNNKNTDNSRLVIRNFIKSTGSNFLKNLASNLIT